MSTLLNTKRIFFLSLSLLIAAPVSLRAHTDNLNPAIEITTADQLTSLLNSMDPVEKKQFEELLDEIAIISHKDKKESSALNQLAALLKKVPYAKLSAVGISLIFAILYWEYVAPYLKKKYPSEQGETLVELPKLVMGSLILDEIKDFLKEMRLAFKEDVYSLVTATKKAIAAL